jgi:hypothetical protein
MRRREFIAGLGGAAAWPLAARAQYPLINSTLRPSRSEAAFLKGLSETDRSKGRMWPSNITGQRFRTLGFLPSPQRPPFMTIMVRA